VVAQTHVARLGNALSNSVDYYNKFLGTIEGKGGAFFYGRQLGELVHSDDELAEIGKLAPDVRAVESPEWTQPLLAVAAGDADAESETSQVPQTPPAAASRHRQLLGSTRVSPTVVMKLVSPAQRGSACRCKWPATQPPPPADIQSKVEPMRAVDLVQSPLSPLRQLDQFMGSVGGQRGEPVEVGKGHDHHVARGIGNALRQIKQCFPRSTKPPAASASSAHSVRDGVVDGRDQVAEHAPQVAGPCGQAGRTPARAAPSAAVM